MVGPGPRDTSEIQRSAIDAASRKGTLLVPALHFARYTHPHPNTPFFLEYCFHLLEGVQGKHVLDFGCGAGENSLLLAARGAHVTGIDISPDLIEIAKQRLALNHQTAEFRVASVYDTGLPNGSVDVVFCMAILHHLEIERAQREILRVLKPGGILIMQEPVRDSRIYDFLRRLIPHSMHDNSEFERPLTKMELDSFCAGFQCQRRRRFRLPFVALAIMLGVAKGRAWRLDRWILDKMPILGRLATVEVRKLQRAELLGL